MTADPEFWRYNISSGSPELLSKVILIRDEDVIGIGNNDNQYQFLADLKQMELMRLHLEKYCSC